MPGNDEEVCVRNALVMMVLLWPLTALAEEPETPAAESTASVAAGEHEIMPAKRALVHVLVEMNLSTDAAFKPFSIAPDLWYGVSDKLTVGLVHSFLGQTGIMGGFGSSLCLAGDANGCDGIYGNVGVDVRYQVKDGGFSVAVDTGLFVVDFDPFQLAGKLGIIGRWRPSPTSKLAVDIAPNMFFGFTGRDGGGAVMATANKEVLTVPATLLYGINAKLALALQAGLVLPFEKAGDNFFVPLSVGADYMLSKRTSIDAAFTLLAITGGNAVAQTGADARTFTLGAGYAF
jgi:hypothetical protein